MSDSNDPNSSQMPTIDYWPNKPTSSTSRYNLIGLYACGAVVLFFVILILTNYPRTSRVTERQNRALCTTHLKSIGEAIRQYQVTQHGALPDSIGSLALNSDLTMNDFNCPSSIAERGEPIWNKTVEQADAILTDPKFSSYIFCGDRVDPKAADPSSVVLFFEPITNHEDGVHILFLDQRVKFIRFDRNQAKVDQMIRDAQAHVRPVRWKPN
ncbi:MAG TPA: hypothetical protein PK402_00275 [Tepidisphaeraceae bacterium]|nr:hypothetical protein [Tepidisphaeraceae bacterium]